MLSNILLCFCTYDYVHVYVLPWSDLYAQKCWVKKCPPQKLTIDNDTIYQKMTPKSGGQKCVQNGFPYYWGRPSAAPNIWY